MPLSIVKQYSVFLVNEPGTLKNVAEILMREKVNIIALSQGVHYDAATFRLAVTHDQEISHILTRAGFTSVKTEAICIETKDRPGLILDISSVLTKHNINIAAIYGSATSDGQSRWIAIVNNITKALNALEESGMFN
ncbi:ACT domain-containing protein [Candidatus Avelusimicrobium caledoniensis]|uniref:ACT domain-containing protein n=1 Tax=Candidatus Avelusimicrobium caledoniensis TaxID=3416220 RepID=UPI003D122220